MKELDERLRGYIAGRAERISENDSDRLVTRALANPALRRRWRPHGLNVTAAVALSLL